jgi:hypothetical protein
VEEDSISGREASEFKLKSVQDSAEERAGQRQSFISFHIFSQNNQDPPRLPDGFSGSPTKH